MNDPDPAEAILSGVVSKLATSRGEGGPHHQRAAAAGDNRPDRDDPVRRGQAHERHPRAECLQPPAHPTQLSAMTQNNGEVETGHEIGIRRPGVLLDFPQPGLVPFR